MNLTKESKITRLTVDGTNYAATASTTDTLAGNTVDMANFDAVTFVVSVGAITGSGTAEIKVESGTDATPSDAAALSGATHTLSGSGESNKTVVIEVERPVERYLRVSITRATANVVVDSVVAIQTKPRVKPVTHSTTVHAAVFVLSPAEAA